MTVRRRRKVNDMQQKVIIRNEVVKIKGRVKVIHIKKDVFDKFLQLKKFKILNKEYEALVPPLDNLQKNTIDVNGLATLVNDYISNARFGVTSSLNVPPAQMVLTTSGGTTTLSYNSNIKSNSQGVTLFMQVFQENNSYTFQYYYVGFDTTNSSYTTSQIELYVSAGSGSTLYSYTDLVRIAYTNLTFTKTSDSFLFIVWLIEFQNIPSYLVPFTPIFSNNSVIYPYGFISVTLYFNNNDCNFTCGGNCPSSNLNGFITYVQNNSVILEFLFGASLGTGVSSVNVLLCTNQKYNNAFNIGGNISAIISPPVSGSIFYVAFATVTITFQVS